MDTKDTTKRPPKIDIEAHTKIKTWAAANGVTMTQALEQAVNLLVDGLPEVKDTSDLMVGRVYYYNGHGGNSGYYRVHGGLGLENIIFTDAGLTHVGFLSGTFHGPIPLPKTKSTA